MLCYNSLMDELQKFSINWILRMSLGFMYMYSGIDLMIYPKSWYWAIRSLPDFVEKSVNLIGLDLFIQTQGAIELLLGLILILWFIPNVLVKLVGAITVLEMFGILLLGGIDSVTFRDFGIMGAAMALYIIIPWHKEPVDIPIRQDINQQTN